MLQKYIKPSAYSDHQAKVRLGQFLMEDTLAGFKIRQKRSNAYVARPSEKGRKYKRHSHFYTGNRAQTWLHSLEVFAEAAQEFIRLCPQKRVNYIRGQRAVTLVQSSL